MSSDEIRAVPEAPPLPASGLFSSTLSADNPADLDMIVPYLYLGSLDAAQDTQLLKNLNISSILTIAEDPLDNQFIKDFKYLFKQAVDAPWTNLLEILEECVDFIHSSLSTGILVHCRYGRSRSASLVIAYLMKIERKPFQEVLRFVKNKRKLVNPNTGFRKQLQLFEASKFKIPQDSPALRSHRLEKAAYFKRIGGKMESITVKDETNQGDEACYKCKMCRTVLFTKNKTVAHLKEESSEENAAANICQEQIFIEPPSWLSDKLENHSGKIHCPKCNAKLGSFDWAGSLCTCGAWVTPSFHVATSKVDYQDNFPKKFPK